jgi:hypothetical protein
MLQNPSLSLPVAEGTVYPLVNTEPIEEDLNRDEKVQAVGFVGNHSELVWLYKLKRSLDHDRTTPGGETPERPSISSLSYFQDEAKISGLDCVDLLSRPHNILLTGSSNTTSTLCIPPSLLLERESSWDNIDPSMRIQLCAPGNDGQLC